MPSIIEAQKLIKDGDFHIAINSLERIFTGYKIKSQIYDPLLQSPYHKGDMIAAVYTLHFDRHPASDIFNNDMWNRTKSHQQARFLGLLSSALGISGMYRFWGAKYVIPDSSKISYREYLVDEFYGFAFAEVKLSPNTAVPVGLVETTRPTFEKYLRSYAGTPFAKLHTVCTEVEYNGVKLIHFPIPYKAITSISFSIVVEL